jgi:hypothetical protein
MPTFRLTLAYLLKAEVSGNIFPSSEDRNIEETTFPSTAEGAENTDVNKQKVKFMATTKSLQKAQESKNSQPKHKSKQNPNIGMPPGRQPQKKAQPTPELLSDWIHSS